MKVNKPNVAYSSIVKIGEDVARLERETGRQYLKLHRGVMDVATLDIESAGVKLELNCRKTQQYTGNDGHPELIETIRGEFALGDARVLVTPGGMAALDLAICSIADQTVWIPEYHWGSWNKILKTHNKDMQFFDDFNLGGFRPEFGAVLLCLPSNPTGFCPGREEIRGFLGHCREKGLTVLLDLPYYYLFNEVGGIEDLFGENTVVLSSFSKSIGLSGYRVGYVATRCEELYQAMRVRSLYKYNSISTLPQMVVDQMIRHGRSICEYKKTTRAHIEKNIEYLERKGLLFDGYPQRPTGPFAIVKMDHAGLMGMRVSSVPLSKFTLVRKAENDTLSRISVAVDHDLFREYFGI